MDQSVRKRRPEDGPPPAETPAFTEVQRIAADLAYNQLKNTGALQRAEADRALRLQIDRQGAAHFTNTGLWA